MVSLRRKALELFAADFPGGFEEGRYRQGELPLLPFPDEKFRLVLSGHFLFLYWDRLGLDFHMASLEELLRVSSGEVRVFPLAGLDSRPCPFLGEVISRVSSEAVEASLEHVPLRFQRGGGLMLRLRRA